MNDTLVTGFTPFDGRAINASWIAARSLEGRARTLEVPVRWGTPLPLISSICERSCPRTIIALGEGRVGWFDIETVARNERKDRPDNDDRHPETNLIVPNGPARITASVDAHAVHRRLADAGVPTRISTDAGQFLCEEMLYTLETLRQRHETLETVMFVHLPPFGTELWYGKRTRPCDEPLLAAFATLLFDTATALRGPEQNVHNARDIA